jgi:hypothetical protein
MKMKENDSNLFGSTYMEEREAYFDARALVRATDIADTIEAFVLGNATKAELINVLAGISR